MFYAKSDFKVSEFGTWKSKHSWGGWYIGLYADHHRYLHSDLEIRQGCSVGSAWSGYYATEQDAWDTVYRFLEKQARQCKSQYLVQGVPGDEKPVIDYEDRINTLERRVRALELLIDRVGDRVSDIVRGDNG